MDTGYPISIHIYLDWRVHCVEASIPINLNYSSLLVRTQMQYYNTLIGKALTDLSQNRTEQNYTNINQTVEQVINQ